jgi:hypothetical protein
MNNIHEEIEIWMASAVTDGLSKEEQQTFETHLAACSSCRDLFKQEKIMSTQLHETLQKDRPNESFEDRMVTKFRRNLENRPSILATIGNFVSRVVQIRLVQFSTAAVALFLMIQLGGVLTQTRVEERERGVSFDVDGNQVWKHDKANSPDPSWDEESPQVVNGVTISPRAHNEGNSDRKLDKATGSERPMEESKGMIGSWSSGGNDNQTGDRDIAMDQISSGDVAGGSGAGGGFGAGVGAGRGGEFAANALEAPHEEKQLQFNKAARAKRKEPAPEQNNVPTGTPSDQKLIRNATLEFEIKSFDESLQTIMKIVEEEKGFIATSDTARLNNGKVRGRVIVKVVPENLERLLLKLRALGELKHQSIGTQDVTKAYSDTQARLRNAQRMETRLLDMLEKATGKMSEILAVEKELSRVREQIESMQGELKLYDSLIQYSTVTLTLYEKDLNQPAEFLLKEEAYLSLFSPDVEKSFREAKQEAEAAKAQILNSNLDRDSSGQVTATLTVLVAPESSDALLLKLKSMGRVDRLTWSNQQIPKGGKGSSDTARVEKDKVKIQVTIMHDSETPSQTAQLTILTSDLEAKAAKAKESAQAAGAELKASDFAQHPNGQEIANLTFRVTMGKYPTLLEQLKSLGKVESLSVQRQDRLKEGKLDEQAPVLVILQLHSRPHIISEDSGIFATLRKTVTQAFESMMWSLGMIGVAAAFLAPWLVLGGGLIWILVRVRRKRLTKKQNS